MFSSMINIFNWKDPGRVTCLRSDSQRSTFDQLVDSGTNAPALLSIISRQPIRLASLSCVLPADDACANCGSFGGEDGVKLKNCTACLLVKHWSSVNCQRAQPPQEAQEGMQYHGMN